MVPKLTVIPFKTWAEDLNSETILLDLGFFLKGNPKLFNKKIKNKKDKT